MRKNLGLPPPDPPPRAPLPRSLDEEERVIEERVRRREKRLAKMFKPLTDEQMAGVIAGHRMIDLGSHEAAYKLSKEMGLGDLRSGHTRYIVRRRNRSKGRLRKMVMRSGWWPFAEAPRDEGRNLWDLLRRADEKTRLDFERRFTLNAGPFSLSDLLAHHYDPGYGPGSGSRRYYELNPPDDALLQLVLQSCARWDDELVMIARRRFRGSTPIST